MTAPSRSLAAAALCVLAASCSDSTPRPGPIAPSPQARRSGEIAPGQIPLRDGSTAVQAPQSLRTDLDEEVRRYIVSRGRWTPARWRVEGAPTALRSRGPSSVETSLAMYMRDGRCYAILGAARGGNITLTLYNIRGTLHQQVGPSARAFMGDDNLCAGGNGLRRLEVGLEQDGGEEAYGLVQVLVRD